MELGNTIRALRKARGMTQEQLAQALGVTVGAVYKWESDRCAPDLSLLVELADLFDTSVDVLLGVKLRGNSMKETVERMKALRRGDADEAAITEAEKALVRYPNCFDVVYSAARIYDMAGIQRREKDKTRRAIALFERALMLIEQNTEPTVCALSLRVDIAQALIAQGEADRAVEMLRAENPNRVNHALIGCTLASACNRPKEAVEYLSHALLDTIVAQFRIVVGYVNAYIKTKRYQEALDILDWLIASYAGLVEPGRMSFLIKDAAVLMSVCAYVLVMMGRRDEARAYLRRAKRDAQQFDAAPDHRVSSMRFFDSSEPVAVYDDLGATAMQGIERMIKEDDCEELAALWEAVCNEE